MGTRRAFIRGAAALPLLAALGPGGVRAGEKMLKGSVFYRERMALPPGAVVTVRLLDVSRADAPALPIAKTVIRPDHQVPVPFELSYDEAEIIDTHSYALAARIDLEGRLLFISARRYAVLTGGADETDILMERVAGRVVPPVGRWLAENILGDGVIDRAQSVLEIGADGSIGGSGGCNTISGKARIVGNRIAFGPIAATRRACVPALGDQEQRFFKALGLARSWRYEPRTEKLTLLGEDGTEVMVLVRHE